MTELPALASPAQAAGFLGIPERTLRRWVRTGRLRVLRTSSGGGGRVRIPRAELARLLSGMEQPGPFRTSTS